jgi:hypothetical protein
MIDKKHYEDAIAVQTACNLSGVVHSFSRAMTAICEEATAKGHGTEWKNNHPICRLFAEQIKFLAGCTDYCKAFTEVEEYIAVENAAEEENAMCRIERNLEVG